ncbi:MAG: glycosyltransferase family 2 protein [Bacteroidia bacterium]
MKLLSFILPVFRNEGSIKITCDRLEELMSAEHSDLHYEIILINDGSDDGSWDEISHVAKENPKIKALSFSRNFGQVPAIIAGSRHCSGEAAVIMSADLQDPVSLISEMIDSWKQSAQIAICYRIDREDSAIANLTSSVFYRFMKIANPKMPKGGFDFVLLDRAAIDVFAQLDERNRFFQGDILWMGFNVRFIPYKRMKRTIGKSQWGFGKKLKYFIDGSLNTSYLPIRFMSVAGVSVALLGFLYALVVVYARFVNEVPFKGYAPIVILLLVIGGMIMLMLGIIGEYLWRIYDEARKRPVYIIKEKLGKWDSANEPSGNKQT